MSLLIALFSVYLALSVTVWSIQDNLIFLAPAYNPEVEVIPEENRIAFNVGEFDLNGIFFIKNPDYPTIIYFGGNAENVFFNYFDFRDKIEANIFAFNYRGYGGNPGTPSADNIISDSKILISHIQSHYDVPSHKLILMGRSLGAGIATQLLTESNASALLVVTPFDSLLNMAKRSMPIFPVSLLLKNDLDSVKVARQSQKPLLMLVAKNDNVIPFQHSKHLFESWQHPEKQLVVIDNADHNTIHNQALFYQSINQFLTRF